MCLVKEIPCAQWVTDWPARSLPSSLPTLPPSLSLSFWPRMNGFRVHLAPSGVLHCCPKVEGKEGRKGHQHHFGRRHHHQWRLWGRRKWREAWRKIYPHVTAWICFHSNTTIVDRIPNRKCRETRQQLILSHDLVLLGWCLDYLHFVCYIQKNINSVRGLVGYE